MDTSRSSPLEQGTGAAPQAGVAVEFHEGPLSDGLWDLYQRTACSYACTREFVEHFEGAERVTLGLVWPPGGGAPCGAFLFSPDGRGSARLLGRFMAPPPETFRAFADALFAREGRLRRLVTSFIDCRLTRGGLGRPVLALREVVEMQIALPGSLAEYERSLDRKFLSHARSYQRRLARERPAARFVTREREEIPLEWMAEVIRLNQQRMASRHVRSVVEGKYRDGVVRVARAHGCVTVLLDGDRVCAGVIDVRCGDEVFGWVIGHDDAYGAYRPGRLVQLAAARHHLEHGGRRFHLLHGQSRQKHDLGGRPAPLAAYAVLRSWGSLRPGDAAALGRKVLGRLVRRSVEWLDRRAGAGYGQAPVKAFLRAAAHRLRELASRRPDTGRGPRPAGGFPHPSRAPGARSPSER